ncbi:MAG: HAD family hydrolase, partial [Planctomycetota bacterium]|nr:HAD family hydrolase [Planctomycetota bacterium]
MANGKQPAVFLDRDGTLIEDRGDLATPAEAVFFPGAAQAVAKLQPHFKLFLVTNQPGIGKGII